MIAEGRTDGLFGGIYMPKFYQGEKEKMLAQPYPK